MCYGFPRVVTRRGEGLHYHNDAICQGREDARIGNVTNRRGIQHDKIESRSGVSQIVRGGELDSQWHSLVAAASAEVPTLGVAGATLTVSAAPGLGSLPLALRAGGVSPPGRPAGSRI